MTTEDTLTRIAALIEARKDSEPEASYVAGLHASPIEHTLKKIGEEATETVLAAKAGKREEIVHETADLWFHSLVMLSRCGLQPADIIAELERRFGTSGLAEKRSRRDDGFSHS